MKIALIEEQISVLKESAVTGNALVDSMDIDRLRQRFKTGCYHGCEKAYKSRLAVLTQLADLEATRNSYKRILSKKHTIDTIFTEADSAESTGEILSSNTYAFQNMVDVVGTVAEETKSGDSTNSQQGQKNVLQLEEFLSRPIPLTSFQVAVGSNTSVTLDVWDLYSLEPSVRAKLRNFAYLRGNLHIRLAISGTPFHYGRFMVSYQPWPEKNETLVSHRINMVLEPSLYRFNYLNYLSQSPGAKCVDVRDNQPVDIICPYISTKPMHRLFNTSSSALSASTSYEDLADAGSLMIYSVAPLGCVSSSPSEISVFLYAWMTDVELGTQTGTQIEVTTEADELETGPVEKVASRLATYASYFSKVPVIGPYARASAIALSGLSSISSVFGWSRPILIHDPQIVKNNPYQNGALTIGSETSYKITLDPKQELTVDPRVMGSGEDEMTIGYLASRESLLTTFTWADDSPVMADPIWVCGVNPKLSTYVPIVSDVFVQPTAMAFATHPFEYWRGTITFRLDIICSAFHRGKLAVFFEPNIHQLSLINADIATNKQFLRIIDIQQTQSVEFDVEWAFPRAWAKTLPNDDALKLHGSYLDLSAFERHCNGYIGVTPFTTLQSPDDSDVYVNVFVYSKDMHVNMLTTEREFSERNLITESALLTEADLVYSKEVSTITLNPSTARIDTISQEHFGEEPLSFRALLKRYQVSAIETIPVAAGTNKIISVIQRITPPPLPTYGAGSKTLPLTLFSYLRYGYIGMRGGIRKRIHFCGIPVQVGTYIQASIRSPTTSVTTVVSTTGALNSMRPLSQGAVEFCPSNNNGIEVELPFYSNNLYAYACAFDDLGATYSGLDNAEWVKLYQVQAEVQAANIQSYFIESTATAEDFTFLRFQGAPYYTITP